jgi:hypothetical protein
MEGHDYLRNFCVTIPEKSHCYSAGRCYVRGVVSYKKKDGLPFTEEEKAIIQKANYGQLTIWSFSEFEAQVKYECDSGD